MIDFEALQRAFENELAQVACPACAGVIQVRVGDMAPGHLTRCGGCDMEVPLQSVPSTDELLGAIKGDLAKAFKRAFKAIEAYSEPPA